MELKLKGSVVCKEFLTRAAKSLKWQRAAAAEWGRSVSLLIFHLVDRRIIFWHFLLQRLRANPTLYSCSIVIALLVLFFFVCCFSRAEANS